MGLLTARAQGRSVNAWSGPTPTGASFGSRGDYSVDFPVWDVTPTLDKENPVTPQSLDISGEVTADILQWQRLSDEHFHWEHGWRDPAARDRYAAQGSQLRDRLQTELGRDIDVVLDLWLAGGAPPR